MIPSPPSKKNNIHKRLSLSMNHTSCAEIKIGTGVGDSPVPSYGMPLARLRQGQHTGGAVSSVFVYPCFPWQSPHRKGSERANSPLDYGSTWITVPSVPNLYMQSDLTKVSSRPVR